MACFPEEDQRRSCFDVWECAHRTIVGNWEFSSCCGCHVRDSSATCMCGIGLREFVFFGRVFVLDYKSGGVAWALEQFLVADIAMDCLVPCACKSGIRSWPVVDRSREDIVAVTQVHVQPQVDLFHV